MSASDSNKAQGCAVDPVSWYSEASLVAGRHYYRAGTLIQCVRKWNDLKTAERSAAVIRMTAPLDGLSTLDATSISKLASRPDFLKV
jgi:hypothetical protein